MSGKDCNKCYNFLSQYVFLTDISPSQMGVVDEDRIFIVYEKTSRIEVYKVNDARQNGANDNDADESEQKQSYELELTIPLFDTEIIQALYCPIGDGYFAFLFHNRSNNLQAIRVYSKWQNPHPFNCGNELDILPTTIINGVPLSQQPNRILQQLFALRLSGELFLVTNHDREKSLQVFEKASQRLNIIHLREDIDNYLPARFISLCKATGTLVVTLERCKILVYRYVRVMPHSKSSFHQTDERTNFYAIDLIHTHTITMTEIIRWLPEAAKISLNYLAMMSNDHFALIRLEFFDDDDIINRQLTKKAAKENAENEHLIVELNSVENYFVKRQRDEFALQNDIQMVFDSLFDSPTSTASTPTDDDTAKVHSESVYGPVPSEPVCPFQVHCYQRAYYDDVKSGIVRFENAPKEMHPHYTSDAQEFDLLICRRLTTLNYYCDSPARHRMMKSFNRVTMDLLGLGTLRNRSESLLDGGEYKKVFQFGFDISPIHDQNSGLIIAHCLYIFHGYQLDCYLIDLRRDSLKLVQISHLELEQKKPTFSSFVSSPIIRDICFCPQQDLIHILINDTLETYCTHFYDFLGTSRPQNLQRTRLVNNSPLLLGCNRFLNQIGLLANQKFLFLISNEGEANRHTIYGLRRPELADLRQDTDANIRELKSFDKSIVNATIERLFEFVVSNCNFALRHNRLSLTEQETLRMIVDKIDKQDGDS